MAHQLAGLKGRISVKRVRLNAGGYEYGRHGRYWGHDLPLFSVSGEDAGDEYVRSPTREGAKAYIRLVLLEAKFYR